MSLRSLAILPATILSFISPAQAETRTPRGGFEPVEVIHVWQEGGRVRRDVHVATRKEESWQIDVHGRPLMKSLGLKLARPPVP